MSATEEGGGGGLFLRWVEWRRDDRDRRMKSKGEVKAELPGIKETFRETKAMWRDATASSPPPCGMLWSAQEPEKENIS